MRKQALLSVSDKTGVVEFARELAAQLPPALHGWHCETHRPSGYPRAGSG